MKHWVKIMVQAEAGVWQTMSIGRLIVLQMYITIKQTEKFLNILPLFNQHRSQLYRYKQRIISIFILYFATGIHILISWPY